MDYLDNDLIKPVNVEKFINDIVTYESEDNPFVVFSKRYLKDLLNNIHTQGKEISISDFISLAKRNFDEEINDSSRSMTLGQLANLALSNIKRFREVIN